MSGEQPPSGMQDFINQQPSSVDSVGSLGANQPPVGMEDFVGPELKEQKFGGIGQQAIAGLEGVARGATLGTSDLAETKLGISTPENIKARMEENPITSGAGSLIGGGALIAGTGGLLAPAEALVGGAGLGATALATAGEGALFGAGSAVSDKALGDPNLNAQKVLTDIGLGTALGLGGGLIAHGIGSVIGKFGGVKGSVAEHVASEANEANTSAETEQALAKLQEPGLKGNTKDLVEAAGRQNIPVMTGMVSDSPWVQKAEDSLINGAPTYSGIKRARMYEDGHQKAVEVLNSVLPTGETSKSELGTVIQDSLANKIDEEAKPFQDLYSEIRQDTQNIPLKNKSAPSIARNIINEIEGDKSIGKNSPAGKLSLDIADEIGDLKTVEELRDYQSGLNQRLSAVSSPSEKRIIAIVRDKLDNWERSTVKDHAEDMIAKWGSPVEGLSPEANEINIQKADRLRTLLSRIDEADKQYAPFRQKISELSEWLGKSKIQGAKHAISFIRNELEPEDLVNKLTQKKYSKMYEFMAKNFPQESAVIKLYQKALLRDQASKTGEFSPKIFFNKVNALEPEIRSSIFHPDEIQKINDIEIYLRSFPKNFNPSGTSGMSAFRKFFESPAGAAVANARDFGIETFIKTMGTLPEGVRPSPQVIGQEAAEKFNKINAVQRILDRQDLEIGKGIRSIISGTAGALTYKSNIDSSFEDKTKRISELANNSDALSAHLENHVHGLDQHLPQTAPAIGTALALQVAFLNSKIPKPHNPILKANNWKPSTVQKIKFDRYYNGAAHPISALHMIKTGSLTSETMEALSVCHPDLLKDMRGKLEASLDLEKANDLSFKTKQSLSLFLGKPVGEAFLQKAGQSNQMAQAQIQAQREQQQAHVPNLKAIGEIKVSQRSQTRTQGLEKDA